MKRCIVIALCNSSPSTGLWDSPRNDSLSVKFTRFGEVVRIYRSNVSIGFQLLVNSRVETNIQVLHSIINIEVHICFLFSPQIHSPSVRPGSHGSSSSLHLSAALSPKQPFFLCMSSSIQEACRASPRERKPSSLHCIWRLFFFCGGDQGAGGRIS